MPRAEQHEPGLESRWRSAFEAAGAGAWEIDLVNETGWCSARHAEIFGYEGEQKDWSRTRFSEHVLEEDIAAVQGEVKRSVARRGNWRFECRIRRADGQIRWISAEANVAYEGARPIRTWGVVTDITQRKLAEIALSDSERRLRLISDHVPALISYLDRELHYRFNNQRYEEWFGEPSRRVTNRHMRDVLGEEHYLEREQFIKRALCGEAVRFEARTPHRRLGIRDTEIDYVPDVDDEGEVRGIVVLASDITERKRAEEALREANRRKDEFLATLSHELRNPLAAICSSLEVRRLRSGAEPDDPTQNILERQVEQMVRLVDDLLDLSRITRGKIDLRRETLNLADVAQWAIEECRPLLEARGQKFSAELPESPLLVAADPVRLAQVVSNLLTNASKFTSAGGCIELTVGLDGDSAILTVRDDGVGIEPQWLPRIFEMFYQGEPSGSFRSGLGIGLTLVQTLVEMHGGSVAVTSAGKGKGSEFRVRLPLVRAAGRVADPPRRSELSAPLEARVLVADDNRDAADSLGMLLAELGVDVEVVYGGTEAVERLDSFRPTVVLLDLGMPGLDGYAVARRIRRSGLHREVLLVAVTGWGGERDMHRTRAAGFDHHLVKPVNLQALHALLVSVQAPV